MTETEPKSGGLPKWLAAVITLAVVGIASKLGINLGTGSQQSTGAPMREVGQESPRQDEDGAPSQPRESATKPGREPEQDEGSQDPEQSIRISELFANKTSGVMVTGTATVKKILRDDLEGSRHQRFILRLEDGHTVLVAHNIDLAPRVPIEEADTVEFHGQYEWNDQGGVVHWTHHDPDGFHEGGWIRAGGRVYE